MAIEILIADSDGADQEEFQKVFEGTAYRPVFSDSGEDALLRTKLFKPDLIIAGVSLREKGGLELCEAIKAEQEFKDIPFVLLTDIFEEISDKERKRIGADGVISKPLREGTILGLLDRLVEERRSAQKGKQEEDDEVLDLATEWNTPLDEKKEKDGAASEGLDEPDEEIIELSDVIEEPESKLSIDDFAITGKEEPLPEMAHLDSWEEKILEEGKKPLELPKAGEVVSLRPVEEKRKEAAKALPVEKKPSQGEKKRDEDLFEKIELEEILEKVERLKPSIQLEFPPEREGKPKMEWGLGIEKTKEELPGFEDFASALKEEVRKEPKKDQPSVELAPLYFGEMEQEVPSKVASVRETPLSVQPPSAAPPSLKAPPVQPPSAAPPSLKAPPVQPRPLEIEVEEEELETFQEEVAEALLEEELRDEDIRIPQRPREEKAERPELQEPPLKEAGEEKIDIFEGLEALELPSLEKLAEQPTKPLREEMLKALRAAEPEEESFKIFEALEKKAEEREAYPLRESEREASESIAIRELAKKRQEVSREPKAPEFPPKRIPPLRGVTERKLEERAEIFKEKEVPGIVREEVRPSARIVDKRMEEVIAKSVQDMIGDFVTKVVPGMTETIVAMTVERIEKAVKEMVPEIAEKLILEEIKRLERGEKD